MKFKKIIYQKVNSTYHDFKLLDGLKFYKSYRFFLKSNQIITNYSQIIEVLKIIDNLRLEEPIFKMELEKIHSLFLSYLEIMVSLDKFSTLEIVNRNYLNNFAVRFYGKYSQQFLEFEIPELTNWITTMFNNEIVEFDLSYYLKIYKNLNELIKVSFQKATFDGKSKLANFYWDLEKQVPILNLLNNLTEINIQQGEK
ncbi:hypothetical protein CXP39_00500 [Mesoplasma syrphidae]|uniref:Uncharacterized protein n=1 Tax=Mesoplasma syrphidae TaxID=225999 RepID=A0A2K9BUA4_9MOLU|nr:hypothetical protein [Mesoplasma syrphidae]AUF83290.1 hypothetical protein CXP39_00500 [Mesoplasma syrphidae]